MNLSVFILCHNRHALAKSAIHSALAQECTDFRLIVSDSSDDNSLEDYCKSISEQLVYRHRSPSLTFLQHIRRCLQECDTQYVCLFHDDDLMHPGFVRSVKELIKKEPDFSGYAINAEVYRPNKSPKPSFLWHAPYRRVRGASALAGIYFSNAQLGFPPFPAYVYKKAHIEKCLPPEDMGKYLDVFILMRMAALQGLLWATRIEMLYRIHGDNDGLNESIRDRRRLIQKIRPLIRIDSRQALDGLRKMTYGNWLQAGGSELTEARRRRIRDLLSVIDRRSKLSWGYWANKALKTYVHWTRRGDSH